MEALTAAVSPLLSSLRHFSAAPTPSLPPHAAGFLRSSLTGEGIVVRSAHIFPVSKMSIRAFSAQSESSSPSSVKAAPVDIARELLNRGHRYLDVRTIEEFTAGHIEGAVNIPFMNKAGIGMVKNGTFVEEVKKKFNQSDEIIVGCQAGKRSKMATSELAAAGFTRLTDMPGGFAEWVASGQPTTT